MVDTQLKELTNKGFDTHLTSLYDLGVCDNRDEMVDFPCQIVVFKILMPSTDPILCVISCRQQHNFASTQEVVMNTT
ncbi:hypothetical protein DAPPUDRAFT_310169 [Daphnia pulex]|uniref:Uncharacterized protein n=1 Tax=Daphnia pulex TaxID=6669 RepID=E9FSQ3_DAPPU|nr:hypothetical protein DAPPUDRAFT_310169 [Daphnia pulex]|eukprot:EFX89784.1 hypothetical protein DAPPUDRAFT_310169 [Daphnia pulex]